MNIFDLQATISLNSSGFETGVQNAQSAFGSLGDTIKGTAIGKLAADAVEKGASAMVDFGKAALNTGMSFDESMANVAAISGSTGETLDALRDKAKEMGASTKFTATEAADAFSYMAMAGWDAEQMMDGISGIMNLAAASGEDLATTSDIVTDALTAFGLSAEDSGHFGDVLAAASSAANTNVGLMGETFKYVAPLAGAMGYSIEDMATAIGIMANSGIKGSQAGTALRSAISQLANPSETVAAALNRLGLSDHAEAAADFAYDMDDLRDEMSAVDKAAKKVADAQDAYNKSLAENGAESDKTIKAQNKLAEAQDKLYEANAKLDSAKKSQIEQATWYNAALQDENGNALAFSETIAKLQAAFSGLSEAEQAEYAATIFGQNAMSGMLAIVNAAPEDVDKLASTISSASDAMGGMGTAAEMAAVQLDNLPGQLTIMQSAFDGFKTAVYEKLKAPLQELASMGADVFSRLTDAVNNGGIIGAFESLGGIVADVVGPKFAELTDSILPGLQDGFANATSAFQPFIDALSGSFENALPAITGAMNELEGVFGNTTLASTMDVIASSVKNLFGAFAEAAADQITGVTGAVAGFLEGFTQGGGFAVIEQVANHAADLFGAFVNASADIIRDIGNGVKAFLAAFPSEEVGGIIAEVAKHAGELFGAFGKITRTVISEVAGAVKTFLAGFDNKAAGGIIADIADAAGSLFGLFTGTLGGIINRVAEAFSGFGKRLAELWNTAGPSLKETGEAVKSVVQGIKQSVDDFMKFVEPVIEWLTSVLAVTVQIAFEQLVVAVGAAWNAIMNIVTAISDAFNGFVALLHGDVAGAAEAFKSAWENIVEFFQNIVDFIVGPFKVLGQKLGDEGDKGVRALKAPFETVWNWFKDIGGNIVAGLKQGIADAWSGLTSWLSDKVSGLTDGIKNLFGIHSPSTVFAGIGENLVLGMREGWGDAFGGLERQIDRDMASINGTAQIGFENSALGKSSAAGISAAFAAMDGGRGGGDPIQINLVLDGDVAATALYDPLRRTAFQRGQNMTEAAYA